MVTKRFERWTLDRFIPYENNPRRNDEAVADVVESIKQCGDLDPIEVDENGVILSGHTRLKAYQQLGFAEADAVIYEGLTDEQKKKYRLLANKTGEKSGWDFEKLDIELEGLDFGEFDFGFETKVSEYIDGFFEDTQEEKKEKETVYGVKIICSTEEEAKQLKEELIQSGYSAELM